MITMGRPTMRRAASNSSTMPTAPTTTSGGVSRPACVTMVR